MSEQKRQQVVALGRLGWSLRRIEEATGVRRETASRYLRVAEVAIRRPGSWGHGRPESKPAIGVITDPAVIGRPEWSRRESRCEEHRTFIESSVERGRNATAIWQDLVDRHGFSGSYQSVRRFVKKLRGAEGFSEARAVIQTAPGEEGQVDYGKGPMIRDPRTGKYRRSRLFVFTLGYSRKSVRLLTMRSSSQKWAELHEEAFRRLGGAPRVAVLDNLKEGVLSPDIYDPELNPLYRDVLAHYGVVALPCRVRDPDRKGKVESAVGHAKQTPLKGLRFESLEEAQAHLDHWEERWADTRIHGTTKTQVGAMFYEEKPHLLPLPVEPFRYYEYGMRSVNLDGHVEVARAYYSAPPGWMGFRVQVQWDERTVRILSLTTGELLREHRRSPRPGRFQTRDEDRPRKTPRRVEELLQRAERIGRNVGTLARKIHDRDGPPGIRRIQGLLGLARKYGAEALREASGAALELEMPSYRFVKRFLERRASLSPALSLKAVDPLIRSLTHYRDLIRDRTEHGQEEQKP